MKKKINILCLFCFLAISCFGQYSQNDLNKYWKYRQRYSNSFVSVGANSGQSIPFTNRNVNRYSTPYTGTDYIAGGETTISLGQYIALLGTEYRLLKINNQDFSNTVKELYYALYAFNRLDLLGETVNGYNKPALLDGFFVREDFPDNFITLHPLNVNASSPNQNIYFSNGKGTPYEVGHTEFEGLLTCAAQDFYYSKYNHTPMSTDHFIGMVFGLTIANKCLDSGINYLNNPFQDGEVDILKEIKNIMDRLLSKAERDSWELKEPDGIFVGNCESNNNTNIADHNGHLTQYSGFLAKIGLDVTGKIYTPASVIVGSSGALGLLSNRSYNVKMTLMMLTFSNVNKPAVLSTSQKHNWNLYYLLIGNLINSWNINEADRSCIESMIASAPCDGPFCHSTTDYAKSGWASDDRFSSFLFKQTFGGTEAEIKAHAGNYSGIDYMLLHNLFRLSTINDGRLPKYLLISSPVSCDESNVTPCKIKNCKRWVKKECRTSCRKECKQVCEDKCSGKKGKLRKWICRQFCKPSCKRECKKECKEKLMEICD